MSSTAPATAKPPFDTLSADSSDVLIRTSDNVNFCLYKVVLILASPFFKDMFSIKQPEARPTPAAILDTEDPISVTENSQTFDCLMRLCYPVDDPVIEELSLLESVLEAAIKYQMSEAKKLSRAMLRTFVQAQPLNVYAISCRLHVEEEAQLAAEAWKAESSSKGHAPQFEQTLVGASFGAKMGTITAGNYYRLLHYLRIRPHSMVRFTDGGDPTGNPDTASASQPPHMAAKPLYDTTETDTILISRDGVECPVHSVVLRAASAAKLMDPWLAELQRDITNDVNASSSPSAFRVDLPSDVLAELVRLCYPIERFNFTDLSLLCSVYAAAEKWRVTRITSAIKNEFFILIERHPNPVSLYFIAVKQGWRTEAEHAARIIARKGIQYSYAMEMEDSFATTYHHLLRFCHDFSSSARARLSSLTPSYAPPQGSPPAMGSLTYAIVANEVNRLSTGNSTQSSSSTCHHGHYRYNCNYGCRNYTMPQVTSINDLLEQSKKWEQKYAEILAEIQLRFHLHESSAEIAEFFSDAHSMLFNS